MSSLLDARLRDRPWGHGRDVRKCGGVGLGGGCCGVSDAVDGLCGRGRCDGVTLDAGVDGLWWQGRRDCVGCDGQVVGGCGGESQGCGCVEDWRGDLEGMD